ncbi:MAG TPA: hypothetical protein VFO97_06470, partial [Desertimonas sp.]|nr:hypothetical protein [Desertimonas sp.]
PTVTPGAGGGLALGTEEASIVIDRAVINRSGLARLSSSAFAAFLALGPTALVATNPGSAHPGSVTAKVTVQGTTLSGNRFARTTTRSVRVG